MRKVLAFGAVLIALSGCVSEPSAPTPTPPAPSRPAPPPLPPPPKEPDHCGAAEAQKFVGRPRSEIPIPLKPNSQRVACTTCPMTMDFRQDRLNFLFDAATGVVKEVKCG